MISYNLPSNRQFKVAELIKRTLAEIFSKGKFLDPILIDVSVTVSEVRVNSDLRVAIVYIIPLTSYKNISNELILQSFTKLAPVLRKKVTQKIKLKYSPELIFKLDDSFNEAQKISHLLNQAHTSEE